MKNEQELAESIRQTCLGAALEAHESGGISGLCLEGRWELAVQAIRCVDLSPLIEVAASGQTNQSRRN